MRNLVVAVVLVLWLASCDASRNIAVKKSANPQNQIGDTIKISNEELEYEIIIIDIGFNAWLATQKPITFYENSTLRYRNNLLVNEWNDRVRQPSRFNPNLYEQRIDYRPNIDYGIEVNYKLYMYFLFFQQRYNQRLLRNNWVPF